MRRANLVAMRTRTASRRCPTSSAPALRPTAFRSARCAAPNARPAQSLGTGHPGGIGTIHAGTGIGALRRRTAHPGSGRHRPRALIAETIDLVAVLSGRGAAPAGRTRPRRGLGPDGDYRLPTPHPCGPPERGPHDPTISPFRQRRRPLASAAGHQRHRGRPGAQPMPSGSVHAVGAPLHPSSGPSKGRSPRSSR